MNLCIFAPNFGLSESVLFTCTDAPVPVCSARLAPEEEGAPHQAHLLSKATKQKPLTFYLCFHLKTETENLHHTELRFAETHFSKLRKSAARQMAHMRLSRGPFRSRGQNRFPVAAGGWLCGQMKRESSTPLQSYGMDMFSQQPGRTLEGQDDSCDLQGQATQDIRTTQD